MEKEPFENHVIIFDLEKGAELRVAFNVVEGVGFCLNDLCDILNLDRRETRRNLDDEEIFQHRSPTDGGLQWMTYVRPDALYEILNRIPFGRVMPFISQLHEWVLKAIVFHATYQWGEDSEEKSFHEMTFHKFDESIHQSTGQSTNRSTNQSTGKSTDVSTDKSTDKSTEITPKSCPKEIVLVINLK